MPSTFLALFRGINVGGKNKLPMKDLIEMFIEAGCQDVRSYIQSGNVIFRAPAKVAAKVPNVVPRRILDRFGFRTSLVLRTAAQLRDIISPNPLIEPGANEESLHVMFLTDLPDAQRVELLDPDRSPGDRFAVRGTEIYLHLPHGVARTKLNNSYFDSKLATTSTSRNWRTVTKLLELMRE